MSQQPMQQPVAGALLDFQAGAILFKEGDPGGDLFFIREGEVEVYKEKDGIEARLAIMKAGEILGIMTCLTRDPRLASARARTAVKAHIVKQAGIKTLITSTPPWVSTVIKDFILRIKNMDQLYWAAQTRLEREERDGALIETAATMAAGLAEIGPLLAQREGAMRVIPLGRSLDHLVPITGAPRDRLETVIGILESSGLLKVDRETQDGTELGALARLPAFADFARRYVASAELRVACNAIDAKECQALIACAEKAGTLGIGARDEARLPLSKLQSGALSVDLIRSAFDKADKAKLARLETHGAEPLAVFVPAALGTAARSLVAVQKLRVESRNQKTRAQESQIQVITESF